MQFLLRLWLLMLIATNVLAGENELPKLELGGLLFGFVTPDYRGSAYSSSYILPVPHIIYRGERFRVDDGVESRLFKSEDLILSISGNGSFPADDDNPERVGMEQLEGTIELGPSLEYRIRQKKRDSVWFEVPLRLAYTIESSSQFIGLILHPRIDKIRSSDVYLP